MDRRGFLKFAAGGTAGLVASPIIWNTLYDAVYWTQNWGWIPRLKKGASEYLPTVSKICPSGTGFLVRTVSGTPVRTIGDRSNPVSRGSITSLAACEAELRVSPSRIKKPLLRSADGAYNAVTWAAAEKLLKEKVAAAGKSIAVFSGDPTSSINEILSAILRTRGSKDFYFMPDDEQPALAAWASMGGKGRIGYDIENSDCILAAAPILESWGVVAGNRATFNSHHPAGAAATQKIIYVGPVQNNTAAGADLWLPVKPGTETVLMLGIANLLIKAGRNAADMEHDYTPSNMKEFADFAAAYTLEKVCATTGVPADRLEEAARMLLEARAPLAIAGSALGSGGAAAPVMAALSINLILARVGSKGGVVALPDHANVIKSAMKYADVMAKPLVSYTQAVAAEKAPAPAVLLIHAANPVYALPADSGAKETIRKAGFTVAVASFFSETCAEADLVLPAALGMEAFDDVQTPYGSGKVTYAFARPVAKPFAEARCAGELYIALAQELSIELGVKDMPDLLYQHAFALGTPFRSMMENGTVYMAESAAATPRLRFNVRGLKAALAAEDPASRLSLAPVVVLGMGTAVTSVPPFAAKTVTDYQICSKLSVAQMNGVTAASLGVDEGSRLRLTADNGTTVEVVVSVFEGVMPATVSLVAGLGHTAFDEFSKGKGANVVSMTSITREPGTNLPVWGTAGLKAARA